jgi:hypothetical protein
MEHTFFHRIVLPQIIISFLASKKVLDKKIIYGLYILWVIKLAQL